MDKTFTTHVKCPICGADVIRGKGDSGAPFGEVFSHCSTSNLNYHYSSVVNNRLSKQITHPYKRDYFHKNQITVGRYFDVNESIVQIAYKCKYFKRLISDAEAVEFLSSYQGLLLML